MNGTTLVYETDNVEWSRKETKLHNQIGHTGHTGFEYKASERGLCQSRAASAFSFSS